MLHQSNLNPEASFEGYICVYCITEPETSHELTAVPSLGVPSGRHWSLTLTALSRHGEACCQSHPSSEPQVPKHRVAAEDFYFCSLVQTRTSSKTPSGEQGEFKTRPEPFRIEGETVRLVGVFSLCTQISERCSRILFVNACALAHSSVLFSSCVWKPRAELGRASQR